MRVSGRLACRAVVPIPTRAASANSRRWDINEAPQMTKELKNAEKLLGKNRPESADMVGMQNLVKTPAFESMRTSVLTQYNILDFTTIRDHMIASLAKSLLRGCAPEIGIHPGEANNPLLLSYRPTILALVAQIYKPNNDMINSIVHIYSCIDAGLNIQKTLSDKISGLKHKKRQELHTKLNMLGIIGSDYLLAFANELVARLDHPEASEKISNALSTIAQLAIIEHEQPDPLKNTMAHLWKECAETIVLVADGTPEELALIGHLFKTMSRGLYALWSDDSAEAVTCKLETMEILSNIEAMRPDSTEYVSQLRSLILASIPVRQYS